jgi:hypothetical protein
MTDENVEITNYGARPKISVVAVSTNEWGRKRAMQGQR